MAGRGQELRCRERLSPCLLALSSLLSLLLLRRLPLLLMSLLLLLLALLSVRMSVRLWEL